jgi:hypothetical protein
VNILFVSSVAIVSAQPAESRKLFIDTLGLPLQRHDGDDYYFGEKVEGAKHFGVWPLSQADVESVCAAARELAAKGYAPLHDARTEPWGQTVARYRESIQTTIWPRPRLPQMAYGTAVSGARFGVD